MGKGNVLVVEYEVIINNCVTLFLKNAGYSVFSAFSVDEAINILEGHQIQCVVTEIMIPRVDGFELCKYIKHNLPNIVVIIASSVVFMNIERIHELDLQYFLQKPFSMDDIVFIVNKALLK